MSFKFYENPSCHHSTRVWGREPPRIVMARDPLKLWFCHILSISTTQACMHAKRSKNKALERQNHPANRPEPSKIEPGARQDAPKSAKRGNETPQKLEHAPKKRPRANKWANMSQLGVNLSQLRDPKSITRKKKVQNANGPIKQMLFQYFEDSGCSKKSNFWSKITKKGSLDRYLLNVF